MLKLNSFNEYYSYVRKKAKTVNKRNFIIERSIGKRVLDLGCIGHSAERFINNKNELHKEILKVAKYVVGIDYLAKDVVKLNNLGYTSIKYGDATDLYLNEKFDVVILGDLIEHISDLKGLFSSIKRHLSQDGILIITTPNPYYINQIISILMQNSVTANDEHTQWFDPYVIFELFQRNGFSIIEFYWLEPSWGTNLGFSFQSIKSIIHSIIKTVLFPFRLLRKVRTYFNSDFLVIAKIN